MTTSTVPPEIIVANPMDICTETFLIIGGYSTREEVINCLSYIKTKFFRALLFFNRHSLNISRDSFELIPLQDFSEPWTDEKLYKKYGLTDEEIAFIESMIRPME
jgi:site-specific DNA-methyltransferase (adenine-specific)